MKVKIETGNIMEPNEWAYNVDTFKCSTPLDIAYKWKEIFNNYDACELQALGNTKDEMPDIVHFYYRWRSK